MKRHYFIYLLFTTLLAYSCCCPDPPPAIDCNSFEAIPSLEMIDDSYLVNSFFRIPIGNNVTVVPNSEAIIQRLITESATTQKIRLGVNDYTETIFYVDNETPRWTVWERNDANGNCSFSSLRDGFKNVPIPDDVLFSPGNDEEFTLIDLGNELIYDFGNYRGPEIQGLFCFNTCRSFGFASVKSLRNSGVIKFEDGDPIVGTRGSGFLSLGGIVWPQELNNGEINHALRGQYSITSTDFVHPAIKSDGTSTDSDAMPMGTLLQLSPTLNVDDPIYGMTPDEKTIAKAMQKYGIYIGDTGGAGLSMSAVSIQSFDCNPYRNVIQSGNNIGGCNSEYSYHANILLDNIPLDSLRVIEYPHAPVIPTLEVTTNDTTKCCIPFANECEACT